jgi:hypothetical protein
MQLPQISWTEQQPLLKGNFIGTAIVDMEYIAGAVGCGPAF